MQRRNSYVLLAVLGVGVFLAGLELMVTAVALPQILATMTNWTDLRKASWIINGYLLVYVVTMPLAGRLTDTWGARRLFLAALAVFTVGSFLAGIAQDLDQLIAARLVQAVGGGAIIPVGTAAASHLFDGPARPRALGVIGALTFLGMAAGPFVGAAVLGTVQPETALANLGISGGPLVATVAPAWRWVFYVNVPIGICGLVIAWAASAGWDTRRVPARVDLLGALLFTVGLAGILFGITLIGSADDFFGLPIELAVGGLLVIGALASVAAVVHGLRRPDPFLDPRLFADRVFSSAALVSLLTGYGMATAIVGGAVFVDRVLYGGPAEQRVVLGALAGAMALGALLSGFLTRLFSLRLMTLAGLALSAGGLLWMSTWTADADTNSFAASAAVFGLGFGLTVTPRSTAAVEAAGRHAFGAASATVTVARMIGMAVGMAALTAYGSTTITRISNEIYGSGDTYKQYIPAYLRDRSLHDGLVVQALESWAANKAASIMVGIFLVAAAVTLVAVVPALALRNEGRGTATAQEGSTEDGTHAEASVS
ncbi:MAG: MFS transporter [Candidatus Limnocylindrales bacterium]|jgi:MFS family permease